MERLEPAFYSVEDFLRFEERSQLQHEYVAGQIFGVTSPTIAHQRLVTNLSGLLHRHTRMTGCITLGPGIMVRVDAADSIYQPDIMVLSGRHPHESFMVNDPVLLVEVLSKSTSSIDRREKRSAYQQIPTLCEYLIVSQRHRHIELLRKARSNRWEERFILTNNDSFTLESMPAAGKLMLSMDDIYEEIDFPPSGDFMVLEETENEYTPVVIGNDTKS